MLLSEGVKLARRRIAVVVKVYPGVLSIEHKADSVETLGIIAADCRDDLEFAPR